MATNSDFNNNFNDTFNTNYNTDYPKGSAIDPKNCTEKITARITKIDTRIKPNGNDTHDVYICYSYKGCTYENKLNYYSSFMKVGSTVTIYINPSNPEFFHSKVVNNFLIVLIILGALPAVLSAIIILIVIINSFAA